jgi:hypothetical protein
MRLGAVGYADRARIVPIVAVLSLAQLLWTGLWSFGIDTSCTDQWSCTDSFCSPCRVVDVAFFGGLGLALVAGVLAIAGPGAHRTRRRSYVVAMAAIAIAAPALASTWH